jgi:hypothetical protein
MEVTDIWDWLKDQAPVIVVMGVVMWWLAKRLVKSETRNEKLTEQVIKIATLWESKSQSLSDDDKEFKKDIYKSLQEIVAIIKSR